MRKAPILFFLSIIVVGIFARTFLVDTKYLEPLFVVIVYTLILGSIFFIGQEGWVAQRANPISNKKILTNIIIGLILFSTAASLRNVADSKSFIALLISLFGITGIALVINNLARLLGSLIRGKANQGMDPTESGSNF